MFDNFEPNFTSPWYDDGIAEKWTWDSLGTSTANTGPASAYGGARYIYVETSSNECYTSGETAIVYEAPAINFDEYTREQIIWWSSMYGINIGTLTLEANNTGSWIPLWTLTGNQGTEWFRTSVDLSGLTGTGTLRFKYTCAGGLYGDAAIDEIGIYGVPSI